MQDEVQTRGGSLQAQAEFATWTGIAGNVFLTVIKLVGGWLSHSASLVADGFHSLSDILSSVVVLIGLRIASRPADKEHPYGHGKAEAVAGKLVSIILIVIAVGMLWKSLATLWKDDTKIPDTLALWIIIASIAVKEGLFQYKIRVAKRTGSTAVLADAWHHRSDAFSSIIALAGVSVTIVGGPEWHFMDHLGAALIALFILYVGISLFRQTAAELLDLCLDGEVPSRVCTLAREVDGVVNTEKVFVRKSGLDLYVDLHVEVDPELTVREGHLISHRVRERLMEEMRSIKGVLVHIEPDRRSRDDLPLPSEAKIRAMDDDESPEQP